VNLERGVLERQRPVEAAREVLDVDHASSIRVT
jgi:hypothetical protein